MIKTFTCFQQDDPPTLVEFGNSLKNMSKRRRIKYKIFLFMKQGMRCHYCKCQMVYNKTGDHEKQPNELATFEHLVDDWASPSGKDNSLDKIVLACRLCNNTRNSERQARAINYYRSKFSSEVEWKEFLTLNRSTHLISLLVSKFGAFSE